MKEEEIRKRYQREDENDARGTNIGAMDRFIEMLHLHEENKDIRIRNIAEKFEYIDTLAPNFTIFEGEKGVFYPTFKAYQIRKNEDMIIATHEFGHAVLLIMNDTRIPEDYGGIIARANEHATSPEVKENFKEYIRYISGNTDKKDERTEGEKGPVSDIISSIFQCQTFTINTEDTLYVLPAYHEPGYYRNEETGELNMKQIFDEDFANYYALKVNNCQQEIETIRRLFGDELVQTLDIELTKVSERLALVAENKISGNLNNDVMEQIKSVVVFSRQSEVQNIKPLEKETEQDISIE